MPVTKKLVVSPRGSEWNGLEEVKRSI